MQIRGLYDCAVIVENYVRAANVNIMLRYNGAIIVIVKLKINIWAIEYCAKIYAQ